MRRRLLPPVLLSLVLVLSVLVAGGSPAGAHTEIQRATPGPGETTTDTVDWVVIDFLDPVAPTPEVTVAGPDGQPVAGLGEPQMLADDVVKVAFDGLADAGTYQVDYAFTSVDGHPRSGSYQFRYQPSSGVDVELRPALAAGVGLVLVGLLGWALLDRRRGAGADQTRSRAADHR